MERNAQKSGLVNMAALLIMGVAAYAVAHYGKTVSGIMTIVFFGLGFLVAAMGWFQTRLEERERLEKLEFDELSKSAASSALFTSGETEVFPAQRSREQFERFFVPAFTVLLVLLEIAGAVVLWRSLQKSGAEPVRQPMVCISLFGMFFLLLFILGRFSTSLARLEKLRFLRPAAACLLLNSYLCLAVTIGLGFSLAYPKVDLYLGYAFIAILLFIGLETLLNLVLEIYRPRMKGKVVRPMYESRLVSLLGQPEGLITTAAQTLDYQFGFKVSETWVYRLFARWLPWLVMGQAGVLLLSTTVVFIDVGEHAVMERFGKFQGVLAPGAHFKLPWPLDRTYLYPTERIQTIEVGHTAENLDIREGTTILWTIEHANEDNFPVANREPSRVETTNAAGRVSLLTVSIPVQYQVTNLPDWFYNNEEPQALLEHIATRQVGRYLVSADLNEIMSVGRADAARILRERIQAEANQRQLGVGILFVGLQDIHPPVKVAAEYEKAIAALHTTNADIRGAIARANEFDSAANTQASKIISEAESERYRRETNAVAQAEMFNHQLRAYQASPSVYIQRAWLDTIANAITNARAYIVYTTNAHNIAMLNLEDKISAGIAESLTLPPPRTTNSPSK